MQLGIIGLGRMGGNIARRLMLNGHTTVVYDRNEAFVKGLSEEGATGVADLKALVAGLQKPRAVWVMLPAGAPTEAGLLSLRYSLPSLKPAACAQLVEVARVMAPAAAAEAARENSRRFI